MSKRTMIGANVRPTVTPGGFLTRKVQYSPRDYVTQVRAAADKFLDDRGLNRGPDAFSGRQAKML